MARVPLGKAFALAPEVLRQTHAGRTWAWRSVFAVVLVAASWWPTRHLLKSMTVLGTMAALVASDSLSSHAIDKGALAVAIYFFHEAAVGVWIGALAGLSLGFATKDLEDGWSSERPRECHARLDGAWPCWYRRECTKPTPRSVSILIIFSTRLMGGLYC
jgi:putative copper export protein